MKENDIMDTKRNEEDGNEGSARIGKPHCIFLLAR